MVGRIPRGIDPDLLYLTGAIVTWCGRIDGILVYSLLAIRQHEACKAIVKKENFPSPTKDIVKQWAKGGSLVLSHDPQAVDRIGQLRQELLDLALDRNDLVHGFWPYGSEPHEGALSLQTLRVRKDGELQLSSLAIDVERLEAVNGRAVLLYRQVMAMMTRFTIPPVVQG